MKSRIVLVLCSALALSLIARAEISAGPVTPPAQAAKAGFTKLGFDEEFSGPLDIGYGKSGHKWNAGLWWQPIPPQSAFSVANNVLTITAGQSKNADPAKSADLCTQYHDASGGKYFLGGYFEARLFCTDWSAFWLFCADRPQVYGQLVKAANSATWTNEIDIIETDPGSPTRAFCTLHANSSGDGGVVDRINSPHAFARPSPLIGTWHIYGLLWTREGLSWYIDNIKVASSPPFVSTWQPVQLILTAAPGGVNGSASSLLPPVTQVSWVRVWEK